MTDPDVSAAPPDHDAILLQRARVLEQIAGSAWHELAQPIGGLRGFVTMLEAEGWTSGRLGVDLRLVDEAALATQRLARTLADLAGGGTRAEAPGMLVADMHALAGHLLVDVRTAVDLPAGLPETRMDPAVLRLVIASLVCDAIQALGGPGRARGSLRWTGREAPGHLELAVEDDGAVAEPADLPFLRRLVAGAGGALRHETPASGGNRIVLTMPLAEQPPAGGA